MSWVRGNGDSWLSVKLLMNGDYTCIWFIHEIQRIPWPLSLPFFFAFPQNRFSDFFGFVFLGRWLEFNYEIIWISSERRRNMEKMGLVGNPSFPHNKSRIRSIKSVKKRANSPCYHPSTTLPNPNCTCLSHEPTNQPCNC